jgi:putative ABC transport system substrate-binding protein
VQEAARGLGLELTAVSVRLADVDNSFAALGERSLDGLVITDDPSLLPLIPWRIALTADGACRRSIHLATRFGEED